MKFNFHSMHASLQKWIVLLLILVGCIGLPSISHAQNGGSVSGTLYLDANEDGNRSAEELGVASHLVRLDGGETPLVTTTDANGNYRFTGVAPGHYIILPEPAEHLNPINPASNMRPVTIDNGQIKDGQDFGYRENCVRIVPKRIVWRTDGSGCFDMTFTLTNLAPYPIGHLFSMNGPPIVMSSAYSTSNNYMPLNPVLAPGQTGTYTVTFCGVPPNSVFTWVVNVHSPDLVLCCQGVAKIKVPRCDCFQVLDETITCNADGSFTWCGTIQSLVTPTVTFALIVPPLGITINPTVTPLPNITYGQIFTLCVNISGPNAIPGSTITLPIILRNNQIICCTRDVDIKLPECFCPTAEPCTPTPLFYDDRMPDGTPWSTAFPGTVAAITCWVDPTKPNYLDQPVVSLQNLANYQTTPTASTTNIDWVPSGLPRGYHGKISTLNPMGEWSTRNLGSVFGITLDKYGNIFVTQTSCYGYDHPIGSAGASQHGTVWLIRKTDGKVFSYINLPNFADTTVSTWNPSQSYPELGNISYNGKDDMLYVTNLEDGKIYAINGTNGNSGTTSQGSWVSTYDPQTAGFTPDPGTPGMVNMGDRLWAVQFYSGRCYFSRWNVDRGNPNPAKFNEIWSVNILPGGGFGTTLQKELTVPHFQAFDWSMPVSDMSFSPDNKMMIAERGLGVLSYPSNGGQINVNVPEWTYPWTAHSSRGIEYRCQGNEWVPTQLQLDLGYIGQQSSYGQSSSESCSGGTDYDYSTASLSSDPKSGRRVWFTMNGYSLYTIGSPPFIYGIQGLHPTLGGNMSTSIDQDADGVVSTSFAKTTIGDVEISCPRPAIAGRVVLNGLSITPQNRAIIVQAIDSAGNVAGETPAYLDENGTFSSVMSIPEGTYRFTVKSKCYLRRAKDNIEAYNPPADLTFSLIPGDIDGDNVVSIYDYIYLSDNFDKSSSDPDWMTAGQGGISPMECDIDGDGVISIADYILLSENFEALGD